MKQMTSMVIIFLASLNILAYSHADIVNACEQYTRYTDLCIELATPPVITETCSNTSGVGGVEYACIKNQVLPDIAKSCSKNSSSYSQQEFCLKNNLSIESMEYCGLNSKTTNEKWECLENAAKK